MTKTNVSRRVTATILSMSLLTVMAGAAIAPALGIIKAHFSEAPAILVQFIVSMPALLIIVTNLFFLPLSRVLRTRAIATTGLLLYIVAGAGCFFMDDIYLLLAMRALLGVSVGLIMPLSTGLLAYYFPPEQLRVPFRNIVYIGDSDTDIPCMKLVNSYGGHSIGVYDPDTRDKTKVLKMMADNRIRYYAPADYSDGSELDSLLKSIIRRTAANEELEDRHNACLPGAD